jgi:hypothetical protein
MRPCGFMTVRLGKFSKQMTCKQPANTFCTSGVAWRGMWCGKQSAKLVADAQCNQQPLHVAVSSVALALARTACGLSECFCCTSPATPATIVSSRGALLAYELVAVLDGVCLGGHLLSGQGVPQCQVHRFHRDGNIALHHQSLTIRLVHLHDHCQ